MTTPRFHRIAEIDRPPVRLRVDGQDVKALRGDTLLTVLMQHRGALRPGEFGDGLRAGFCAMGACQDCWISAADGRRLRACSTYVEDGMDIMTGIAADD